MSDSIIDLARIGRYVAIGDSQTEGLHDYHAEGIPRGWADRFAERLSSHNPELLYANLAVRGKRASGVREEQLGPALALAPDLVTVVAGVNDAVSPGYDLAAVSREIESMYRALVSAGCLVMGCTFPLPSAGLTRRAAPRLRSLNVSIRAAASRNGVFLVELEDIAMAADLRLWDADRIHLNSDGHRRLAGAFEGVLTGVTDGKWTEPLPPAPQPPRLLNVAREAAWLARFAVPKLVRTIRGRSSGDGREAKRPELLPLTSPAARVRSSRRETSASFPAKSRQM